MHMLIIQFVCMMHLKASSGCCLLQMHAGCYLPSTKLSVNMSFFFPSQWWQPVNKLIRGCFWVGCFQRYSRLGCSRPCVWIGCDFSSLQLNYYMPVSLDTAYAMFPCSVKWKYYQLLFELCIYFIWKAAHKCQAADTYGTNWCDMPN